MDRGREEKDHSKDGERVLWVSFFFFFLGGGGGGGGGYMIWYRKLRFRRCLLG